MQNKVKSTAKFMESFQKQLKPHSSFKSKTGSLKKLEYKTEPNSFIRSPTRLSPRNMTNKDLSILAEYERLSAQFKLQNDELLKKTAEFDNIDSM